jgi:outer membrane receptor protein involved in Fe transport
MRFPRRHGIGCLPAVLLLSGVWGGRSVPAEPVADAGQNRTAPSPDDLVAPDAVLGLYSDVATLTSRLLSRVPASVTVVPGERLRELGARFVPDGLRVVPGLEVMRMSSTDVNISARGFNDESSASQGVLGLLDGRQIYNEFYGGVLWDQIPVVWDDLKRVEVIRGPGSFLHGPNAMHGLVNFVTRSPLEYNRDEIDLTTAYGSYNSAMAVLTYVNREEHAGFKAKMAWDDINEFEPSTENAKDKGFAEVRYETRLGGREDQTLDLTAGISRQKSSVLISTFAGIPPAFFDNEATEEFVMARYALSAFKAKFSWTHFEVDIQPSQVYAPFSVRLDTVDLDLRDTLVLGGNTVTFGTGYRFATVVSEETDVTDGRHQTGLVWVFAQDEVDLVPESLWLTAGLRGDFHSVTGAHFSPRLALVWQVDPGSEQYLRAAAGYGFRNPSLRELWFDMPLNIPGLPVSPVIHGNRDLNAEQMRSFELGYSGRWGENAQTAVDAVLFFNLSDREVEYRATAYYPSPPFPPQTPSDAMPVNVVNDRTYGGELEVKHPFAEGVEGFANYSYSIRQNRSTGYRVPLAPRNKANGGVRWAAFDDFLATVWVTCFDETYGYDPAGGDPKGEKVPAYALLNSRLAWTFRRDKAQATAFLQGFNLLDHDHLEHVEGNTYGPLILGGVEISW